MTVQELIVALHAFPPEATVVGWWDDTTWDIHRVVNLDGEVIVDVSIDADDFDTLMAERPTPEKEER